MPRGKARVNYLFLFELEPDDALTPIEAATIATRQLILTLLLLLLFGLQYQLPQAHLWVSFSLVIDSIHQRFRDACLCCPFAQLRHGLRLE